ncbi:matrix metalloproteinase-14 isoform X1 [Bombus vosnesenskii]|uniref:Matrix metalloproteinase-14 isoform X1 n=2 Tax=Pyrobombus TaxID=144703 RepID=A0A6J3KAJ7_9HYME|nr:matrix metalloproteinase-14 isoform X1 [Bombus impatiens]XP_033350128.1 matrix metalloproteinase-14 isoform X1 [Bombus vosnesenskii]XP_050475651.1 matrix metalloproteinase-14 isoform X1 [Bombus huntii]
MARWNRMFAWERCVGSVLLATLFAVSHVKSEEQKSTVSQTAAMNYLSQFGYLQPINPTSGGIISQDTLSKAISEFQAFAGLNITGDFDDETFKLMALPRCGVKDKVGPGFGRSKRYALQGSRWRVKKLTYKISKYPRNLPQHKVDDELNKAFKVWSEYTDLVFIQKKSGQVHIEIRFEKGEHGDGDPFDGPGGTLAHAYFPVYGGDAHFDDAEQWTIDSFRGTNLFQVAAHEFGHSLGLSHSDVKAALMAPFYRGYQPYFQLDDDDIQGIQALYGKKSANSGGVPTGPRYGTTTASPPSEEDSELCTDPKVDTMFNSAEGHMYAFKGDRYWRLTADGVAVGYPKLISHSWKGLPGNIDAAFTYKNGKTYFFKGSKYWRYVGKRMDGDYPKEISEGFTGIPDNIDTVTVWTGNGKIYFYKGAKFWRFDPAQKPPVKNTYPKLISNWEGIPNNLDASIVYRGYTYFFKGDAYYRFNDRTFSVDVADPAFPRATAYWWFGCRSANKGTLGNVQWLHENPEDIFPHAGILTPDDGDHDSDDDEVGDIILDAGETDEQLVTSSNQDADSAAGNVSTATSISWYLPFSLMTMIFAKIVATT